MDLTALESPLREKVQAFVATNAKGAEVIARLLEKRVVASPSERERIDKALTYLVTPSKNIGWILAAAGISLAAGVIGFQVWSNRQQDTNVASGEPVVAKVTRLEDGNCVIGAKGNKCLQLGLELHPQGRAVYAGNVTHDLPLQWASRVQPGSWITVAVDRTDPSKVYFDEKSMAVEAPKPVP